MNFLECIKIAKDTGKWFRYKYPSGGNTLWLCMNDRKCIVYADGAVKGENVIISIEAMLEDTWEIKKNGMKVILKRSTLMVYYAGFGEKVIIENVELYNGRLVFIDDGDNIWEKVIPVKPDEAPTIIGDKNE